MLDKFLVLLERFVVAHELIAANSARPNIADKIREAVEDGAVKAAIAGNKELPVEGEEIIDTPKRSDAANRKAKPAAKPEPEDDLDDDEEPEEKPVRKAKAKPAPKEESTVDIDTVRAEIKQIAQHIGNGDSDECADEFDELLASYKVRTVPKLPEAVVVEFLKKTKALVSKFYYTED